MNKNLKTALAVAGVATMGVAVYHQFHRRKFSGFKFKRSIIVDRPPGELYRFWRDVRNLPLLVESLESVVPLGGNRSRWTMKSAAGIPVSWEAEITSDRNEEMIGWRSVDGSTIETAGYVKFIPAIGGRRTLVRVALEYYPPAGYIGTGVAALFGRTPVMMVEQALRQFKQLFETGEIARSNTWQENTSLPVNGEKRNQFPGFVENPYV